MLNDEAYTVIAESCKFTLSSLVVYFFSFIVQFYVMLDVSVKIPMKKSVNTKAIYASENFWALKFQASIVE